VFATSHAPSNWKAAREQLDTDVDVDTLVEDLARLATITDDVLDVIGEGPEDCREGSLFLAQRLDCGRGGHSHERHSTAPE
jgi:hypothetical protein